MRYFAMVAMLCVGCAHADADSPAPDAGAAAQAARPAKPIPDLEPDVERQVREILLQQAGPGLTPERFTERGGAGSAELGTRLRGYGALLSLELLARNTDGEDRLYRYRARYDNATALVDITFNKANRIHLLRVEAEDSAMDGSRNK
ncbi:hypothetical protein AAKU55_000002 [Oxalobacteraceae bacterium GrIS 1.11]